MYIYVFLFFFQELCVACLLPEKRSEILEMILPERLLAETEDKVMALL